jgi:hypothetical protein
VITLEQHLLIWLKKNDVIVDYVRINNLHVCGVEVLLILVMIVLLSFNKIIAGLEMFGLFLKITPERGENF